MTKILSHAAIAVALSLLSQPLHAAEHVLFEIPLDMNKNEEADRAMLVIVGETVNIKEAEPLETYPLEKGQRADLLIFLDVGDDAVNVTDPPTIRKEGVSVSDGLNFVMPPETNAKGSLNIITSNGFGNTFNTTETLTVVYRNGQFVVAGLAIDLYARGEEAHCSVNLINGKGVKRLFEESKNRAIKGTFKQFITLDRWSYATRPDICDGLND